MSLFSDAERLLSRAGREDKEASRGKESTPGAGQTMSEARKLLAELGYVHREECGGAIREVSCDQATRENRLALLALAGRLERVFSLPSPKTPGAYFLGGEIAPSAFGLASPDGPLVGLAGRGTTLREAFEGCIGEGAEYLSLLPFGDEPLVRAAPADMLSGIGGIENPVTEDDLAWMQAAIGLDPVPAAGQMDWLPATSLDGRRQIHVPADLCLRRWGHMEDPPPRPAESNGCAAGPTLEDAQYRALLELVERDAMALWWYGGRVVGSFDLDEERRQALSAFMAKCRCRDSRVDWFLDLTNDLDIPVVAALSSEPDGSGVVFGFAADLDPLAAAKSAALEMCQMEIAQDLVHLKLEQRGAAALNAADLRHLERERRLHINAFPQLKPAEPPACPAAERPTLDDAPLGRCYEAVRRAGYEAYSLDLTRPETRIPAVRVVVPGLQSAKADWITERLKRTARHPFFDSKTWRGLPPLD